MSTSTIPETNFDNELFSYEYLLEANVCRLCWTGDGTVEIFNRSNRSSEVGEQQLVDKIRDCLNLDLDPDLHPEKLCSSCSDIIESFHKYKYFCHESDKKLKKIYEKHAETLPHVINTDIKIEEVTGEDASGEIQSVGIRIELEDVSNEEEGDDNEIAEENEFDKFQRSLNIDKMFVKELDCMKRALKENSSNQDIMNHASDDEDARHTEILPRSPGDNSTSPATNKSNKPTIDKKEKSPLNTNKTNKETRKSQRINTKNNKSKPRKPFHTKNCLPEFCTKCGMIFEDLHQLSSHSLQAHGITVDSKMYKCYGCNREFPKKYTRVRHELIFCKEIKDGYKCPLCSRYLPYRKVLQGHLKEHNSPQEAVKLPDNIFKCKKCQKSFKTREKLIMHKKMGDPKHPKKDYVCETCGRVFSRADYLYQHRVLHTGAKKHKCPHCSYSAAQRTSLVIHLRSHTGERPYPCDLCPQRCVSKSNLIAHRRRHQGENRHQCPMCPKLFGYKTSLEDHIANSHERPVSYVCQYCRATYGRKSCLDRHTRLKHTIFKQTREARECADFRMLLVVDQPNRGNMKV